MKRFGKVFLIAVLSVVLITILYALFINMNSDIKVSENNDASVVSETTSASDVTDTTLEVIGSAEKDNNMLIAENKFFNAEYVKAEQIPGVDGAFGIYIKIKNNSDISEVFLLEDVYVDNTKVDFSGSAVPQTVLPGKNLNGAFSITYPQKVEDAKIIEFKITCMDNNYEKVFTTDTITINQ